MEMVIMFNNPRYITSGVQARVPAPLQHILWHIIDTMEGKRSCLQVFHLEPHGEAQRITHTQENPPYKEEYDITVGRDEPLVTAILFAIDDETHSTLIMADEY